ncbi:MAG: OmpA family protein [Melioribacteraceae bacterium]|nr:OmpA family protein [Melioribacteraceae bacterium]
MEAQNAEAELYSPQTFKKAFQFYTTSKNKLKEGGNLTDIRDEIDQSEKLFLEAIKFTKLAKVSFKDLIQNRADAISVVSETHAKEKWSAAEEKFTEAMTEMENYELEDAKETAGEAETAYRTAELNAIEVSLIGPAEKYLQTAIEMDAADNVPKTLAKAQRSIDEVTKLLSENRYDSGNSVTLARNAIINAKHALNLTKLINSLKENDTPIEDVLLENEKQLWIIANKMDLNVNFAEGSQVPREQILAGITNLQSLNSEQSELIKTKNTEMLGMQGKLQQMKNTIEEYSTEQLSLQKKIEAKRDFENKILMIGNRFNKDEGEVFRSEENVIIRLYGLTFPSGKSEIKPEFFGLLRKVKSGINEFDNCNVIIEGHTDSRGSDKINQQLSEKRANAVREYLLANTNLSGSEVTATGFGKTKPVANNETEEGRAKNRRIDVVIKPIITE